MSESSVLQPQSIPLKMFCWKIPYNWQSIHVDGLEHVEYVMYYVFQYLARQEAEVLRKQKKKKIKALRLWKHSHKVQWMRFIISATARSINRRDITYLDMLEKTFHSCNMTCIDQGFFELMCRLTLFHFFFVTVEWKCALRRSMTNLGKSYSKYESHPWTFVKVGHNLVKPGHQRKKKISESHPHPPSKTIRHRVLWTASLYIWTSAL